MPDTPVSAKWLTDREKAIAIKRVTEDQLGVKNSMTITPTNLVSSPD